ncbi:hypothetical protein [Variovorax sp. KK3]|uniref:hypothetical protein n=1 Tax=Variovorax sp. KK3 TaxID=1855728 RepID=UPI00117D3E24|nr:hypothetical protein [Variovorax sp. KK3]
MKAEALVLSAIFAVLLMLVPVAGGGLGLSWDAINHHIYLGWVADRARFDLDIWPAATQSFQFPYLYWPAYKLYSSGASAMEAGIALAALQCICVPAVWVLARVCIPDRSWFGTGMRAIAMGMAFASSVVLSMFNTTANDLVSAIPLIWAIALVSTNLLEDKKPRRSLVLCMAVGLLCGASVAFKLSNGPIAVSVPLLFLIKVDGRRLTAALTAYVAMIAGFGLAYAPWGLELAHRFGNPVFPHFDSFLGGAAP